MPSNLQAYRQMTDHAALQITDTHQRRMTFLQTAALELFPDFDDEECVGLSMMCYVVGEGS